MPFEASLPSLDSLTAAEAVSACAVLLAFGLLLSTFEALWRWRDFRPLGIYSWRILATRRRLHRRPRLERLAQVALGFPGILGVYGLQAVAAAALLAHPWWPDLLRPALVMMAATQLAINYRNGFGEDGSDQMNAVIVLPLALYALTPGSSLVLTGALAFIALQSCLAYVASGVSKAYSPVWRSGEAVFAIMNTASYGSRPLALLLRERQALSQALAWSVIVMETLFPLCLFVDGPWFWVFLFWGFSFHLYCAVVMGLNSFLWAFTATYPVLLWARGVTAG